MRRNLFTLSAAVSLALFIASLVSCTRTLGHFQYATWAGSQHDIKFYSWSGLMGLSFTVGNGPLTRHGWQYHRRVNPGYSSALSPVQPGPTRWGFAVHVTRTNGPPRGNWRLDGWPVLSVFAPYWFLLCATAALPLWWLWRRSIERLLRRGGLCASCGYDLRATPERGGALLDRCPECGAVPMKASV